MPVDSHLGSACSVHPFTRLPHTIEHYTVQRLEKYGTQRRPNGAPWLEFTLSVSNYKLRSPTCCIVSFSGTPSLETVLSASINRPTRIPFVLKISRSYQRPRLFKARSLLTSVAPFCTALARSTDQERWFSNSGNARTWTHFLAF